MLTSMEVSNHHVVTLLVDKRGNILRPLLQVIINSNDKLSAAMG
jgi:hypothetical protein